jgi:hypothetical protein
MCQALINIDTDALVRKATDVSGSDWNGRATERTTVFRYYISIIMYKYIYIYIIY